MGMQQGLAFHKLRLLKLFKVFSFRKSFEHLVLYASHMHMQRSNTIK
jgi:hypothetical protein